MEAIAVFPMRQNVGSHPLMDFSGHGCDEVVGTEEGRNFGYVLNLEPVESPERINKGCERGVKSDSGSFGWSTRRGEDSGRP